jgi:hypothetical protein
MKLVLQDEFNQFVSGLEVLPEKTVDAHGMLSPFGREWTVPKNTAVIMFTLPGRVAWNPEILAILAGTNYQRKKTYRLPLRKSNRARLKTGNLAGRQDGGYSVMYVAGDTIPDQKLVFFNKDRLKMLYNHTTEKSHYANNKQERLLSDVVIKQGPGVYFVTACRSCLPGFISNGLNLRTLSLQEMAARTRQRHLSPSTNIRTNAPYATIARKSNLESRRTFMQNSIRLLPNGMLKSELISSSKPILEAFLEWLHSNNHTKITKSQLSHVFARLITLMTMTTIPSIIKISSFLDFLLATFYCYFFFYLVFRAITQHNMVCLLSHKAGKMILRRFGQQRRTNVAPNGLTAYMQRQGMNTSNKTHVEKAKQDLLKKFDFHTGNAANVERKYYEHMIRMPPNRYGSNRNRHEHSELETAKNIYFNKIKVVRNTKAIKN